MTPSEKKGLQSKCENLHGERLQKLLPLWTRSKTFSIIHILQNNVDKQFLIAPHERSVQKLIESRIIRKSIFLIVDPFSRIASHIPVCNSSKPVFNIPVSSQVVFQYCRPILISSIPLTVSPIRLFFFQFLYWRVFYFPNLLLLFLLVLWIPAVKFPTFMLSFSLLRLSKFLLFYSSILVFIIPVPIPSFALLLSVSKSFILMRHVWIFSLSSPFAWGSASWRHLRDGTRNPSIHCPPFAVLALPAYRQSSLTFYSTLQFPKFQSIMTFPRLPTIHLSPSPSVTFPGYFPLLTFPNPTFCSLIYNIFVQF